MKAFFYQLLLKILPQQVFITRFPNAIDHIAVAYPSRRIYKIRLIRNGIMHYYPVGQYSDRSYEDCLVNGLLGWRAVPYTSKACYVDKFDGDDYDAKYLGPKSWPDQVKAMYKYDNYIKSDKAGPSVLTIVLRRF